MRRRVFCYITRIVRDGHGRPVPQLLVFRHPQPDGGIQTPGGTIDPGEDVLAAARREAMEETGLANLSDGRLFATDMFDHPTDPVQRYHVHLKQAGETPETWTHRVSAGEQDAGMLFQLFWLPFPEAKCQVLWHMVERLDDLPMD